MSNLSWISGKFKY